MYLELAPGDPPSWAQNWKGMCGLGNSVCVSGGLCLPLSVPLRLSSVSFSSCLSKGSPSSAELEPPGPMDGSRGAGALPQVPQWAWSQVLFIPCSINCEFCGPGGGAGGPRMDITYLAGVGVSCLSRSWDAGLGRTRWAFVYTW